MSLFPEYWRDIRRMELSYEVWWDAQDRARKEATLTRLRKAEQYRKRHRFEMMDRTCIFCRMTAVEFHSFRRENIECPKFVEVSSSKE